MGIPWRGVRAAQTANVVTTKRQENDREEEPLRRSYEHGARESILAAGRDRSRFAASLRGADPGYFDRNRRAEFNKIATSGKLCAAAAQMGGRTPVAASAIPMTL